jgi:hypothetical protein
MMAALVSIPRGIMSALENRYHRARAALKSLVQGMHPGTRRELPRDSAVHEIEAKRAMSTAVY